MSKKRFLKGTLILTCTGLLSRLMGFFYRIFLSHSIGAHGLGVFQLILPVQMLVMAVTTSGVQTAISRLAASRLALGQEQKARDYLLLGTVFSFVFSAVLSAIVRKNAVFLAVQILKEPMAASLIVLLSYSFPLGALHSCINSYYLAQKRTAFPAGIQLLEQTIRVGSGYLIYLVFLSEGRPLTPVIAVAGTLCGEMASALVSLLIIGGNFHRHQYTLRRMEKPLAAFRELHHMALPLSLNRVLVTLLSSIEVVLIPQMLRLFGLNAKEALSIYGVFTGMALPLILFPATITNSASVMLMPSIAELQALGYKRRIDYVVQQTCRYCLLLGGGCTLLFFLFGRPMGMLLFKSPTAGACIRTMSFICPFLYLNTTLSSILNGLGKPGLCLIHNVAGISVRIAFVVLAIPRIGIRGYLYGILFSELLRCVLHLFALLHHKGEEKSS